MSPRETVVASLRPKAGAWRVGWRWKVWAIVGSWFYVEISGRRFYLSVGRWHVESEVRRG